MLLRFMSARSLLALLFAVWLPTAASAQTQPQAPQSRPASGPAEGRRLPTDVTSLHTLELPGRTLRFRATAGSLPLVDPTGTVQAEIGFVSYRLEDADPATRPVTFAVNGGPGASSAYLHLLLAGPWRLAADANRLAPSTPPITVPNPETWLDFTDLVFLDPVGTGYSRANGPEAEVKDRYYSVEGDIASLAAAIARWLRENDRLGSPKFFLGESYGGFRGPLLAARLATDTGVGFSGLSLVSPVLDFGWLSEPRWKPMEFVTKLPSLAAAARERAGPVSRADLAEVERYAAGDYLSDLLRGPGDKDAEARLETRVAALTGLDPDLVHRRGGRIDTGTFRREVGRQEGRVANAYDTGSSTFDPDPASPDMEGDSAGLASFTAPLTGAMVDHLGRRLGWRVPNARYELLNGAVNGDWRFGRRGRRAAEAFSDLRSSLALDPNLRVVVAHGLTDLVTPYFATELLLRQLPAFGGERRAELATFPGGHMFYTRDASRVAFRETARAMYAKTLEGRRAD